MGLSRFAFLALLVLFLFQVIVILNKGFMGSAGICGKKGVLLVLTGDDVLGVEKGRTFKINGEMEIGRKPENDIVINDPFISGYHLAIKRINGGFTVTDLNSKNGTVVNDEMITPDTAMPLSSGDEIVLGDVSFKFIEEAE